MKVVQGSSRKGDLGDYINILSGTSQNVVGIAVAALATFGANILLSRTLGTGAFGTVTVMTQAAFVLSFATRAGMDMAVLRDVAVEVGVDHRERVRTPVARAALIAGVVSVVAAAAVAAGAPAVRRLFSIEPASHPWVVEAAANMAIRRAQAYVDGKNNLRWGEFVRTFAATAAADG